jgi:hypothetical protein
MLHPTSIDRAAGRRPEPVLDVVVGPVAPPQPPGKVPPAPTSLDVFRQLCVRERALGPWCRAAVADRIAS